MKNEMKKNLKQLPVKELMIMLRDLESEEMKLRIKINATGYPKEPYGKPFGNINRIKKDKARIKTWLNIKIKQDQNDTQRNSKTL